MALIFLMIVFAYIIVAGLTVYLVGKYTASKTAKYLVIAVFALIPTWDIIPGQLYFYYLCEREAGIKVFKTVEMEKEFFASNGQPDEKKLSSRYAQPDKFNRGFSPLFHIAKSESMIQNRQTGEILGSATDFAYRGGWFTVFVLPDAAGTSCPAYPNFSVHAVIWREVIKPKLGPA